MKYEFRGATGRVCCAGDGPEEYLCADCRAGKNKQTIAPAAKPVLRTDAEWNAHFAALLGVGSLVIEPDGLPDGYRAALEGRRPEPEALEGANGEPYDPFGIPPAAPRRTVVEVAGDHSLTTDLDAVAAAVGDWLRTLP